MSPTQTTIFETRAFNRREFSVIRSSQPWPCSSPQTSPQPRSPAWLKGSDSPACCAPFFFKHITAWPHASVGLELFHSEKYYKICSHSQKPRLYRCVLSLPAVAIFVYSYRVYWVVFCSKRRTKGITYSTVGLFTYAHMWAYLRGLERSLRTDQRQQSTSSLNNLKWS